MQGCTTLCTTVATARRPTPTAASAAPTSPPMSACDELEGRPNHQVSEVPGDCAEQAREHRLRVVWSGCDDAVPTVFATAVVSSAPARFATAAMSTATAG